MAPRVRAAVISCHHHRAFVLHLSFPVREEAHTPPGGPTEAYPAEVEGVGVGLWPPLTCPPDGGGGKRKLLPENPETLPPGSPADYWTLATAEAALNKTIAAIMSSNPKPDLVLFGENQPCNHS